MYEFIKYYFVYFVLILYFPFLPLVMLASVGFGYTAKEVWQTYKEVWRDNKDGLI